MAGALRHRGPDELGVYRDDAPGSRTRACRSSISPAASSRCATRTARCGSSSTARSSTTSSCAPSCVALGHRFRTQQRHRGDRPRLRGVGRATRSRASTASSRSRCGTRATPRWCWRATGSGVRPLYYCEHGGRLLLRQRGEGAVRGRSRRCRARFDPVGLDQTFTFWSVVPPRTRVRRASRELRAGPRAHLLARAACASTRRSGSPRYPTAPRALPRLARRGGRGGARRARAGDAAAHAARRRAGRQLPLGRARQLARRGARAGARRASGFAPSRCASRTPSTTRPTYQRAMVRAPRQRAPRGGRLARATSPTAFPEVVRHAERPILRTAPAPLFLLSQLVRDAGIKVVLTGEGADEMFAGYDLFREAQGAALLGARSRTRRCARGCSSGSTRTWRARRSRSGRWRAQFFGRDLERRGEPGLLARAALARRPARSSGCSRRDAAARSSGPRRRRASCSATLPAEFARWRPLAQDQYLEVRTLLSGYLLSSQGDRMLMAHSVEGRFPFLDADVVELANSLPADVQAARARREARAQARRRAGLVPAAIVAPQEAALPRARRALVRRPRTRRPGSTSVMSERGRRARPACSSPAAVQQLWQKCQRARRRVAVLQRRQHGAWSACCPRSSSTEQLIDGAARRRARPRRDARRPSSRA